MRTLYFCIMKFWTLSTIILLYISCNNPIEEALASKSPLIKVVKDDIKKYEVQILFTQIDSTDAGLITFTDHAYQVDSKAYFYPASTVKLPMAIFAAEFVDDQEKLSIDVPYITDRDKTLHTMADDYRQIFAVSDNESYNRLYEIIGRDRVNERFREMNLSKTPARIAHRLSTKNAAEATRSEIKFFPSYVDEAITIPASTDTSIENIISSNIKKGTGFIKDGALVNEPMDFKAKNYFPLEAQHNLMKRLFFPANFEASTRFQLKEETRKRVINTMKIIPRIARYTDGDYYDSYVKFFMYGDTKNPIPDHIEIYNKVGYAYGTLTETALIKDTSTGMQFLVSATILVNANGIYNDDIYEYETIGIPFLAELGRTFYAQEKKRLE